LFRLDGLDIGEVRARPAARLFFMSAARPRTGIFLPSSMKQAPLGNRFIESDAVARIYTSMSLVARGRREMQLHASNEHELRAHICKL